MRQNTTASDDGPDQRVELLVTTDGQLQMPWGDPLDPQVLGCVSGQFQELGSEVFQDGAGVDRCLGSDADVVLGSSLEVSVNTSNRELWGNNWRVQMSASVSLSSVVTTAALP